MLPYDNHTNGETETIPMSNEIEGVKRIISQLNPVEAEQIIKTVFGELLAYPYLNEVERDHLERRRLELLSTVTSGENRAA